MRSDHATLYPFLQMHMKHLTACGHLNGTAHPVHIRFEMEGLSVTYVVRPGTGSKGRATYAKLGFQREGGRKRVLMGAAYIMPGM